MRRLALRALPLRLVLDLAPGAYLREFNHGRMEVEVSGGHAKFKHYEWMSSPASCASWQGSYEGAFAIRKVAARVRKEECILHGDEFCGYAAEWDD